MSPLAVLILFIICVAIAIVVNSKFGINVGIVGGALAYILGTFVMGISTSTLINYCTWTLNFNVITAALFFAYPSQNGTLEKLAKKTLILCKGSSIAFPWAIFLASYVVSALGANPVVSILAVGSIAFTINKEFKLHPMILVVTLATAAGVGSFWPWNAVGAMIGGAYSAQGGLDTETATLLNYKCAIWATVAGIIVEFVAIAVYGGFKKRAKAEIPQVEKFNKEQKISMWIIMIVLILSLIFGVLNIFVPGVPFIQSMSGKMSFQLLALIGCCVYAFLKMGDHKAAVASVPWSVVLLTSGMGMLMGVAKEGGALDLLTQLISDGVPMWLMGGVFAILGGVLTLFSSGVVVWQMLAAVAGPITIATGCNPGALMIGFIITASCAAISPFSTAGAMCLSVIDEKDTKKVFTQELIWAFIIMFIVAIMNCLGLFSIF